MIVDSIHGILYSYVQLIEGVLVYVDFIGVLH